jgi:hypothetical protein
MRLMNKQTNNCGKCRGGVAVRASCMTRGLGQETAWNINDITLTLRAQATTITIHWVPGHTNIQGYEDADALALI